MTHGMVETYFTTRPRFSGKDMERDGNRVELRKEEFCHEILEYF